MAFPLHLAAAVKLVPGPHLTPAPAGPYRTSGNHIFDALGRAYLIRGTDLPTFSLTDYALPFGPFSPTAFATLRHRMNMNAVRLPLSAGEYQRDPRYRAAAKEVVERANRFELLVILSEAPHEALAVDAESSFWSRCAADFKSNFQVFLAIAPGASILDGEGFTLNAHWRMWRSRMDPLVAAIRSAGATQPIIAATFPDALLLRGLTPELLINDPNLIYQTSPRYATTRTERDRSTQFGELSRRVPVLVDGMDPEFDSRSSECEAFPHDPAAASQTVRDNLTYFDDHSISWTISTLQPGRLITSYRYFTWTKLDDGWTCGSPAVDGIAMTLLAHLWNSGDVHGVFTVNQTTGGFRLARGSVATAYGPIMADRELDGGAPPLPTALGNISVRVTDSHGVARLARLLHTGAGWAQVSFVVPDDAALGTAEVAIVRTDGTHSAGNAVITDIAPGLWTAAHDGRGPVIGQVTQRLANGKTKEFPAWECPNGECRTLAIPMSGDAVTSVRLEGTGIRHAGPHAKVRVTVGDVPVPVLSFGALPGGPRDYVTIQLPGALQGRGEMDLVMTVDDAISNAVRINCGSL